MTDKDAAQQTTKADLVKEAEALGLPTEGTKDELMERVEAAAQNGKPGIRGIRGDEPQYVAPGE